MIDPISPPGGWGGQKPPSGVQVNRLHPSSAGLIDAFVFNEQAGGNTRSALTGEPLTLAGAAKWGACQQGSGVVTAASGDYLASAVTNKYQIVGDEPFSAGVVVNSTGINEVYPGLMACRSTITEGAWWFYSTTPSLHVAFSYRAAGTSYMLQWTAVYPGVGYHSFFIVKRPGATLELFVDGASKGVKTISTMPVAGNHPLCVGTSSTSAPLYATFGTYLAAYLWRRALAAHEPAALHTQPYLMFGE